MVLLCVFRTMYLQDTFVTLQNMICAKHIFIMFIFLVDQPFPKMCILLKYRKDLSVLESQAPPCVYNTLSLQVPFIITLWIRAYIFSCPLWGLLVLVTEWFRWSLHPAFLTVDFLVLVGQGKSDILLGILVKAGLSSGPLACHSYSFWYCCSL